MRAVIAAPDHRDDAHLIVNELHDWLMGDAELRHVASVSRIRQHAPGTMGALDVIEIVVDQGIAALNLAVAYATWRSTRRTPPGLVVTLPGGTLTVTDDSPEALERILAALREDPASPPAGPGHAETGHADGPGRHDDGAGGGPAEGDASGAA